jgi:hypothetical protein
MLVHLKRYKVSSYTFFILPLYPSYNLLTPFPLLFTFLNTNFLQLDLKAVKDKDSKDDFKGGSRGTGFRDDNNKNKDNNNNSNKE